MRSRVFFAAMAAGYFCLAASQPGYCGKDSGYYDGALSASSVSEKKAAVQEPSLKDVKTKPPKKSFFKKPFLKKEKKKEQETLHV